MKSLLYITKTLVLNDFWANMRGASLFIATLLFGAALLGLSGWFITATGIAGIAGIGIAFDVFRPSAGIRFFALGRAVSRYGERVLTHDATLRALALLRVSLLRQHTRSDARQLMKLRSEAVLTRIIADVDALDGVILRLFIPILAAIITQLSVFFFLLWLIGWPIASVIFLGYGLLTSIILYRLAKKSFEPSSRVEAGLQKLRRATIDMIRDRETLIISSQLSEREEQLIALDHDVRRAAFTLDQSNRFAAARLSIMVFVIAGAAFGIGGLMFSHGLIDAPTGAIGFFVTLALSESVLPLRRGFSELGSMTQAANSIEHDSLTQKNTLKSSHLQDDDVKVKDVKRNGIKSSSAKNQETLSNLASAPVLIKSHDTTDLFVKSRNPELTISLHSGKSLALCGPSGSGKTTLLMQMAGVLPPSSDQLIKINGCDIAHWNETALRKTLALVPQYSTLMSGTIRDNVSLFTPDIHDTLIWSALEAVGLADAIKQRGGLGARLSEGGKGLSGGQEKRLSIARSLILKRKILLIDEPTEGLDTLSADQLLNGVRNFLPDTIIIAALHRNADHPIFDSHITLGDGCLHHYSNSD